MALTDIVLMLATILISSPIQSSSIHPPFRHFWFYKSFIYFPFRAVHIFIARKKNTLFMPIVWFLFFPLLVVAAAIGVCPVLCSGHGHYGGGMCHCEEGFKGPECEIPAGECQVPGCSGHGRCIDGECHCERGHKGHDCSIREYHIFYFIFFFFIHSVVAEFGILNKERFFYLLHFIHSFNSMILCKMIFVEPDWLVNKFYYAIFELAFRMTRFFFLFNSWLYGSFLHRSRYLHQRTMLL